KSTFTTNVLTSKVAVTVVSASTVTSHAPVPVQAPDQPAKSELASATATNDTVVPVATTRVSLAFRVSVPPMVTLPPPAPSMLIVSVLVSTSAVTSAGASALASAVSVQVSPAAVQPVQPVNDEPASAVATSVTVAFCCTLTVPVAESVSPSSTTSTLP